MPQFSARRAAVVFVGIALLLTGLMGRVAYLGTYGRQKHIRSAERQTHTAMSIPGRRGSIYDRHGYVLAGTIQTLAVYLDPGFLCEQYKGRPAAMDADLDRLAKAIDCDPDELAKVVGERAATRYVRVAENQSEETAAAIARLDIPGVGVEPMAVRYYPMGSLAAHVLGTVNSSGEGLEGVELRFQAELAGKLGFRRIAKDARRRPIGIEADDFVPPTHGQHLMLTIDANIQMIAEQELAAACKQFKAKRGEVVVMDPKTGEVLALANWPTFNPQNLSDSTDELRLNRSIVVPYEPGSTLKPFIMGPGLAGHHTRMTEMWRIPGITYVTPYGRRVTDVHHYGPLCTWDVLVKSSNIGMAMLAERMGNTNLHKALTSFGFGRPTGIELPGEDEGRVNPLRRWSRYSTESVAQGYEMMVTPLQLARAFCVYGNGGRLVTPRLVRGRLDAQGQVVERYPPIRLEDCPEAVSADAVSQMKTIMSDVVVRGTGTKARSKHWNIFGKTGTSHVSQGRAGYAAGRFNSSFIAGAPLEDPRIIIALILHEPDRSIAHYGGTVSAPAAKRVIERTMAYLQVPESPPLPTPPPSVVPVLHNYRAQLYQDPAQTASAH